eukprot:CAMPEP_0198132744 /NCGR_PEP_ID=MMETSP1442-20131203/59004_1 /TAXON_ID= /ORGANISM="Craspedostauros australis, Strain CCMP3328" /LENGTH=114 /DNA_ID=CAMNT_0043793817 /DNA_START=20 /DNA_END=360 /DNA_ORIENTATION=-
MMRWLAQEGPQAAKHLDHAHPVAVFLLHYSIVITATILAHDAMMSMYGDNAHTNFNTNSRMSDECDGSQDDATMRQVSNFFGMYCLFLFAWRLRLHHTHPKLRWHRHAIWYEFT